MIITDHYTQNMYYFSKKNGTYELLQRALIKLMMEMNSLLINGTANNPKPLFISYMG